MRGNQQSGYYRKRDVPVYLGTLLLSETAAAAQSVAVGWTIYLVSKSAFALGLMGMAQFVPMFLFTLPAGELCDRYSPRRILVAGLVLEGLCALAFVSLTLAPAHLLWPFYLVLLGLGTARALAEPAGQALLPLLVPLDRLPRAVALNSSVWQVAVIAGPALGGLCAALGPGWAFALCGVCFFAAALGVAALRGRRPELGERTTLRAALRRLGEALQFVRSQPVVLGALSLDLFVVLLGGAMSLLPVYASDILHVGPIGLGVLRSAPAVGACVVGIVLMRHPPVRGVGLQLFVAVMVFGLSTLVFAVSTSFVLSLLSLLVIGASDVVSVNIRASLVQLATPDAMRGRVSAVNMLFIGASSELGTFESGMTAALVGTMPAVALGGIATLVVAVCLMGAFPALRKADKLPEGAVS